ELEALSMGEDIVVLRDGAVVQQGSPDDLYETPANLYVAGKIGSPAINVVKAQASLDGRALDTPFGAMPLLARTAAPGGEAILLGIRPSDIRVLPHGEAGISGTVHLVEPLGDVTIVSFAAAGETLRVVLPESQAVRLRPGDNVPLRIDPGKIHV